MNAHRNHRQRGQAMLELALLLPMLLILTLGVIELGRYAFQAILVGNAARAGAAWGAQSLPQSVDTTGIQTAADNDFQNNGQSLSDLAVTSAVACGCDNAGTLTSEVCTTTASPTAGTCAAGHWVVMESVTATGSFTGLFNYPGIPSTMSVTRTATLRVAQ